MCSQDWSPFPKQPFQISVHIKVTLRSHLHNKSHSLTHSCDRGACLATNCCHCTAPPTDWGGLLHHKPWNSSLHCRNRGETLIFQHNSVQTSAKILDTDYISSMETFTLHFNVVSGTAYSNLYSSHKSCAVNELCAVCLYDYLHFKSPAIKYTPQTSYNRNSSLYWVWH